MKKNLPYRDILFLALIFAIAILMGGHSASGIISFLALLFGLLAGILIAVKYAENIAHRVGQPFGSLILAVSVTVIEVSVLISLVQEAGEDNPYFVRDTVFATLMVILTGLSGLIVIFGSLKNKYQEFSLQAVKITFTVLILMSAVILVLPNFSTSKEGAFYTDTQLIFVGVITLFLYVSFLVTQNVTHVDVFTHSVDSSSGSEKGYEAGGMPFYLTFLLLLLSLGAVVLVSESIVPIIDQAVTAYDLPYQLVGIMLAAMILMPETVSSIREARNNKLQNALNLAFGSALATIGLTIPTIAVYALSFDVSMALGLEIKDMVLFLLSLVINLVIFSTGRASVLQGICLITLFVTYLFLLFFP